MENVRKIIPINGKAIRASIIENGYALEVEYIDDKQMKKQKKFTSRQKMVYILSKEKEIEVFLANEDVKGTIEYLDKYFPQVKASTLSLDDIFLTHVPQDQEERKLMLMITEAIKSGLSDFRAQSMDATLDKKGNISYLAGMNPISDKTASWWQENAKNFMPEKNSRLGSKKQRVVFLAILIKELIEKEGYSVGKAWRVVCKESKELGHYRNSKNSSYKLEVTGSRQVGQWYDLANTSKIVTDERQKFYLVNGNLNHYDYNWPFMYFHNISPFDESQGYITGWVVMDV